MTGRLRREAKTGNGKERIRLQKVQRLRAQQCDRLMFEVETAWRAKRRERAESLLEKVVHVNSHHTDRSPARSGHPGRGGAPR